LTGNLPSPYIGTPLVDNRKTLSSVFEAEVGASINESINKATSMAIQAAVIDTIREGARKGHWNFKPEEKNNELVQNKSVGNAERKPDQVCKCK
jgi:hypothetical protein